MGEYATDDERKSAAWRIARQRTGKDAVPADVTVTPLAHGCRVDVVQRMVDAELAYGTPERVVRAAVLSLDTLTATTIRHACARIATDEVDARREADTAHASRTRPADRSEYERLDHLLDTDYDAAVVQIRESTVLTADEREVLTAAAKRIGLLQDLPS